MPKELNLLDMQKIGTMARYIEREHEDRILLSKPPMELDVDWVKYVILL